MTLFKRRPRLAGATVTVSAAPDLAFDADDVQRRALGNLSIPRSLHGLAVQLVEDPHAGLYEESQAREKLGAIVDELVQRGLAARFDGVHSADQLIACTDDVLPLPEPKRELTHARFADSWSERLDGSPQYYLTPAGLAFLKGES